MGMFCNFRYGRCGPYHTSNMENMYYYFKKPPTSKFFRPYSLSAASMASICPWASSHWAKCRSSRR